MKTEDLLALAALGGGLAAFKKKADKDYAELPEQKELAARRAKRREELDSFVAKNRKASPEELSEARRKAASEELNLKNTGRRKTPMVDSSGNPITTRYGGYAHTEGMKKGGKVKKYANGGATESKSLPRRMYENVMGTPEQNAEAQKRMDERDKKNPDSMPAKINRAVKTVTGKKKGGSVSSRGDGIAQRGKTKGRML